MPRMDSPQAESQLVKLLLIGDGKIGKTHFAGIAGQHFNVLYLNGDVGGQTLATLPMEARRNIYLMNIHDTILGGMRDTKMIDTMQEFTTKIKMVWDDTNQEIAKIGNRKTNEFWELTPGKMDHNSILVIDSWTALTESMMLQAARANGVQQETASTTEMRPVYQSAGLKATNILQIIRAIDCHVIVIAHPDEFQHKTAPEGRKVKDVKENDMVIDWTKMIPKSTSRPHGLQIASKFTDVAWMEMSPAGNERRLNFKVRHSHVSGGHFDESKSVEEYSFANLVKKIGGVVPDSPPPPDAWLRILPPEGETESKVLDGTNSTPIKGLAGLGAK